MTEAAADIAIDIAAALGESARFDDLEWRLDNLYWIVDKQNKSVPFRMNAQQRQLFEETLAADEASLQAQL